MKIINRELIYDYENMLIGKKSTMSSYLFSKSPYENEKKALYVIDYAIKTYLRWGPEQVRDCLTLEVIKKLKFDKLLDYIRFPGVIQIDRNDDLFYLAVKLYPRQIHYNEIELIIRVYKKVLNGKIQRFPKEFLTGATGLYRATLCFRYMISQFLNFESIEEMYTFFSSSAGSRELRKYRLATVSKDLFVSDIDYLHESLPMSQKDELFYIYYKFCKTLE